MGAKKKIISLVDAATTIGDSLVNLAANLGTDVDKRSHSRFTGRSFDADELDKMYTDDWISGKVIDIPADDMVRNWRRFTSPETDPDKVDVVTQVEKDLNVKATTGEAVKWGRLYGGALVVLGVVDRLGLPNEPLEVDRIQSGDLKFLKVLDRYDVKSEDINTTDPEADNYRKPTFYRPINSETPIHYTRVLRFESGVRTPWRMASALDSWAVSVLQRVYDSILNSQGTADSVASLVYQSTIDVIKIQNLTQQLSAPDGEQSVLKRFVLANMIKSNNNMLLLDGTEDYTRNTHSFGGNALPALVSKYYDIVSAASDIPVTRLMGSSPGGLNSTGAGDLENYYNMIQGKQETELAPALRQLDQVMVRSAIGEYPADWSFEFNPLWQLSDEAVATMQLTKAQRDDIYLRNAVILPSIVAKQLKEDKTYNDLDNDFIEVLEDLDESDLEDSDEADTTPPPESVDDDQGGEDEGE